MKATTKIRMAVLAVAVCAFVAVPAGAFAWMPDLPEMPTFEVPEIGTPPVEIAKPNLNVHLIDPSVIHEIVAAGSDETTLGEPPLDIEDLPEWAPGDPGDEAPVVEDPTHRVPSITATPSVTTTPTPVVPRRPYLPYTGGDATPFIVIGALVALGGCALVLVPALVRKANAR